MGSINQGMMMIVSVILGYMAFHWHVTNLLVATAIYETNSFFLRNGWNFMNTLPSLWCNLVCLEIM